MTENGHPDIVSAGIMRTSRLVNYVYALLAAPLAVLLRLALMPLLGPGVQYITIFAVTAGVAVLGGLGPAVVAAFLGAVLTDYFFIAPLYVFHFNVPFISRTAVVVLTSAFIGYVGDMLRGARIKAESHAEALRKSELKYRTVADNTYDWEFWLDPDGRFLYSSPSCQRMTGYTPEDFKADPELRRRLIHPDDLAVFENHLHDVEATRMVHYGEWRVVRPDGSECWISHVCRPVFSDDGQYLGVRCSNRDATQRKRAEEALQRTNEELEQRVQERTSKLSAEIAERKRAEEAVKAERQRLYDVMETLPVYVILLSEDYFVPHANRFFRERFGESGGKRCYEYLFSRTMPCENCRTFEVLKTNAPLEWDWTGPDGRNYSIYDFPFTDTNGSRLILEMGIDVTEEKRLREGLERQTTHLRELASELTLAEQRERRRIAEALHDDLQQLLVAAKLRVGLMECEKNSAMHDMATDIDNLLSQSIDVSRTLTAELSPFLLREGRLAPAMEWLAKWMSEKHGLTVMVNIAENLPAIMEDVAALLFQSVKELLFNVVKHANVKTARLDLTIQDDRIKIIVSDNGAGFDPSQIPIHGGEAGGFGLLSVKERLGFMGGSMEVESAPGGGTRITLESPSFKPAVLPR